MIVIIEVSGGCVTSVRGDHDDLQVILVDHDNMDAGDQEVWFPAEEFTKRDEQLLAKLSERV